MLLKIGRGQNVSGEQLWADATTMTKIQIEKMVGRMKRPAKLRIRATLSMPYSMDQLLLAIRDYEGPYGKVAEKLKVWRRPFGPIPGQAKKKSGSEDEEKQEEMPPNSSDSDNDGNNDNDDDDDAKKEEEKEKEEKKKKKNGNKKTNDWVIIQEVIYSPKEAKRLSQEYKYIKSSLARVEKDIEAYLRSIAGKLKLYNEVNNRMKKIEEMSNYR